MARLRPLGGGESISLTPIDDEEDGKIGRLIEVTGKAFIAPVKAGIELPTATARLGQRVGRAVGTGFARGRAAAAEEVAVQELLRPAQLREAQRRGIKLTPSREEEAQATPDVLKISEQLREAQRRKEAVAVPEPIDRIERAVAQGDLRGTIKEFLRAPAQVGAFFATESMARNPTALVASFVPMLGTFIGSFSAEQRAGLAQGLNDEMQRRGYDPTKPDDLTRMLNDEAALESVIDKARVGAFTLAGTETGIEVATLGLLRAMPQPAVQALVQIVSEMVGEGGGEAAKQAVVEGKVNWAEAFLEAFSTTGQSIATTLGTQVTGIARSEGAGQRELTEADVAKAVLDQLFGAMGRVDRLMEATRGRGMTPEESVQMQEDLAIIRGGQPMVMVQALQEKRGNVLTALGADEDVTVADERGRSPEDFISRLTSEDFGENNPPGEEVVREIELGADKDRLIDLLGAKMYASSLARVTVKETVQNSFDAIKAAQDLGILKGPGRIDVNVNQRERTVGIADNGIGMSPDTIEKAFFTIGGSEKIGDPRRNTGGFGLAKMAFLLGAEHITLESIKDGVKTTTTVSSEQIRKRKIPLAVSKTSEPNGTKVTVKIPERYYNIDTGKDESIHMPSGGWAYDVGLNQQIIGTNVEVRLNNDLLDTTSQIPALFTTATTEWGELDIYVGTEENRYADHKIHGSGMYQFDYRFKHKGNRIPFVIYVDIKSKVQASARNYPFNHKREGFNGLIEADIEALSIYLGNLYQAALNRQVFESFQGMTGLPRPGQPSVAPSEVSPLVFDPAKAQPWFGQAPQGLTISSEGVFDSTTGEQHVGVREEDEGAGRVRRTFKPAKEVPDVSDVQISFPSDDPDVAVYVNSTNIEWTSIFPESVEMFSELSEVMRAIREEIFTYLPDYGETVPEGKSLRIGIIMDKGVAGQNISDPANIIGINPLAAKGNRARGIAQGLLHFILHEFVHQKIGDEADNGTAFTTEFAALWSRVYDIPGFERHGTNLEAIIRKHATTYNDMRVAYNANTTRNIKKTLPGFKNYEPGHGLSRDRRPGELTQPLGGERDSPRRAAGPRRRPVLSPLPSASESLGDILAGFGRSVERPGVEDNPELVRGKVRVNLPSGQPSLDVNVPASPGLTRNHMKSQVMEAFGLTEEQAEVALAVGIDARAAALGMTPDAFIRMYIEGVSRGRPGEGELFQLENVNDLFYSRMLDEMEKAGLPRSATPGEYLARLEDMVNKGKIKKAEWEWNTVKEWLQRHVELGTETVTREEVVSATIEGTPIIGEVVYGASPEVERELRDALAAAAEEVIDFFVEAPDRLFVPTSRQGNHVVFESTATGLTITLRVDEGHEAIAALSQEELEQGLELMDEDLDDPIVRAALFSQDARDHIRQVVAQAEHDLTTRNGLMFLLRGQDVRHRYLTAIDNLETQQAVGSARWSGIAHKGGSGYTEYLLTLVNSRGRAFQQTHFSDVTDLLVHVRVKYYVDSERKRVLFIEEVQSDWFQRGRKYGYYGDMTLEERRTKARQLGHELDEIKDKLELIRRDILRAQFGGFNLIVEDTDSPNWVNVRVDVEGARFVRMQRSRYQDLILYGPSWNLQADMNELRAAANVTARTGTILELIGERTRLTGEASDLERRVFYLRKPIPEGPFKDTRVWVGLALKRMLRLAVDRGVDYVAWSTGEHNVILSHMPDEGTLFYNQTIGSVMKDISKERVITRDFGDAEHEQELLREYREAWEAHEKAKADEASAPKEGNIRRRMHSRTLDAFSRLSDAKRALESLLKDATLMHGRYQAIEMTPKAKDRAKGPHTYYQDERASVQFAADGRAIIRALSESADIFSFMHEVGHVWRRTLTDEELTTAEKLFGVKDGEWDVAAEERFARAFERYLAEGKTGHKGLRGIFAKLRNWFIGIFRAIPETENYSPAIREFFDSLIAPAARQMVVPPREGVRELYQTDAKGDLKTIKGDVRTIDDIRKSRGFQDLSPKEKVGFEESMREAERQGLFDPDEISKVTSVILANPIPTSAEVHVALVYRAGVVRNQLFDLEAEVAALPPERATALQNELQRKSIEYELLTKAIRISGTMTGRALAIRRVGIDLETRTVDQELTRARARKGRDLSNIELAEITKWAKAVREQDKKLRKVERDLGTTLERALAKEQAEEQLKRELKAAKLAAKKEDVEANIRELMKAFIDAGGFGLLTLSGLPPEALYHVGLVAVEVIKLGVLTLEEVTHMTKGVYAMTGVTLEDIDVWEGLNTRDPSLKKRTRSEFEIRKGQLKTEARLRARVAQLVRRLELTEDANGNLIDPRTGQVVADPVDQKRARKARSPVVKQLMKEISQLEAVLYQTERDDATLARILEKIAVVKDHIANSTRPSKHKRPEERSDIQEAREALRQWQAVMNTQDKIREVEETLSDPDKLAQEAARRSRERPVKEVIPELVLERAKLAQLRARLNETIADLRPWRDLTGPEIMHQVFGLHRNLLAMGEMSYVLRQNILLVSGSWFSWKRGKMVWRAFTQAWRAYFKRLDAHMADVQMKGDVVRQVVRERADLYLAPLEIGAINEAEEAWQNRILAAGARGEKRLYERIFGPTNRNIVGPLSLLAAWSRASERHAVVFSNLLRAAVFDDFVANMPYMDEGKMKAAASYINAASGRGNMSHGVAAALSSVFFSGRFAFSRWQAPYYFLRHIRDKDLRKLMAKDFAGMGINAALMLGLAAAAGIKVELDPDDKDFAKLIIGNTRVDLFGGHLQPLRLVLRLMIGTGKAWAGKEIDLDPTSLVTTFSKYKLAPTLGLASELMSKKDIFGRPTTFFKTLVTHHVPLFIQDIVEALNDLGAAGTAIAPLVWFGTSTITFADELEAEDLRPIFKQADYHPKAPEFIPFHKMSESQRRRAVETAEIIGLPVELHPTAVKNFRLAWNNLFAARVRALGPTKMLRKAEREPLRQDLERVNEEVTKTIRDYMQQLHPSMTPELQKNLSKQVLRASETALQD